MKLSDLASTAQLSALADAALQNADMLQPHHSHGAVESVREAEYRGHHIVIRTTYQIQVDDVTIDAALHVGNDGHVHYHAIPNLDFSSAIDLVKKLIDTFPDDFQGAGGEHPHH